MFTSSIVVMKTKPALLVEEDFGPKAMALFSFACQCVHYGLFPLPSPAQLAVQPFSSTLLTNRKKNRVKIKLPNNFVANLSH